MFQLLLALSAFAADPLVIDGNGALKTYTCAAGQIVTIKGSTNNLTFAGDCGAISVEGSTNNLTFDGLAGVTVVGSNNQILYTRDLSGKPKLPVKLTGVANAVTKK